MSTKPVSAPAAVPTVDQFTVDMTKVDPALVNKALKKVGLPITGDFEVRVNRLLEDQVNKTPATTLAMCLVEDGGCGGPSNTTLFEACPYCGMADAPPTGETAAAPAAAPAVVDAPPVTEGKPTVKKATAAAKPVTLAVVPNEPVAHAAELVPGVSEDALDEALSRVTAAKSSSASCYWDLGAAIRDIYDRRLYTQRKDAKGKPLYASWDSFVKAELGLSKTHVFNAMDVSKAFTREDFMLVGVSKLALIAKLEPAAQADLLERARKGLPKAQVSDEVRRLAGMGHGRKAGSTGRKDPVGAKRGTTPNKKATTAAAPPKLAADQLTAIVTRERVSIPMFARPKPNPKKDDKPVRAMKVAQDPYGTHELPNGVVVHLRLVLEAKGLTVKMEFKPPAPAKE